MRRIFLYLLLLIPGLAGAQPSIHDGYGRTLFPWFAGTPPETAPYFNLEPFAGLGTGRVYLDLQQSGTKPTYALIDRATGGITPVAFDPPLHAGGWRLDSAYAEASARGMDLILCLQGAFANQALPAGTSYRKHPAIDAEADPGRVESYRPYNLLAAQFALRYGPDEDDDAASVYQGATAFLSTDLRTGLNTVRWIQGFNEANFPWHGGPHVLTGWETGIAWAGTVHEVRKVSPNVGLVAPSFLGVTEAILRDFMEGYIEGCRQLGVEPRWDWHPSFHRYHREGGMGQTQGADVGASPEYVSAHLLFEAMARVSNEYGTLPPFCTEVGWNDDPRAEAVKQRAPLQEGFNLSESVALLEIRNLLMAQASGVDRVYFYGARDNYEGQPYTFTGWTFDRWHPTYGTVTQWALKPGAEFVLDWMDRYGDYAVVRGSYRADAGVHSVDVTLAGQPMGQLRWTDGTALGNVTPEPRLFVTDPDEPGAPTVPEPAPCVADTVFVDRIVEIPVEVPVPVSGEPWTAGDTTILETSAARILIITKR